MHRVPSTKHTDIVAPQPKGPSLLPPRPAAFLARSYPAFIREQLPANNAPNMEAQGGGCPVRHSPPSQSATSINGSPDESSSVRPLRHQHQQSTAAAAASASGGLWSGVASLIPFRGSRNDQKQQVPTTDIQTRTNLNSITASGSSTSSCPVVSESTGAPQPADAESSGCPVKNGSAVSSARNGNGGADSPSPAFNVLNNEFAYGHERAPDQAIPLSTSRQQSSIPKADFNPAHQPKASACNTSACNTHQYCTCWTPLH